MGYTAGIVTIYRVQYSCVLRIAQATVIRQADWCTRKEISTLSHVKQMRKREKIRVVFKTVETREVAKTERDWSSSSEKRTRERWTKRLFLQEVCHFAVFPFLLIKVLISTEGVSWSPSYFFPFSFRSHLLKPPKFAISCWSPRRTWRDSQTND